MKKSEARLYLVALANGIDPLTGEILPSDHMLHDESVAEALRTAIKSLEEGPPTDDTRWIRQNGKLNAGRPWTDDDNRELLRLHRAQIPVEEIARKLQRRTRGVNNQLSLLYAPEQAVSNHNKMWTADEEAQLEALIASRMTLKEIADSMGRSVRAIEYRLERMGLQHVYSTDDQE